MILLSLARIEARGIEQAAVVDLAEIARKWSSARGIGEPRYISTIPLRRRYGETSFG